MFSDFKNYSQTSERISGKTCELSKYTSWAENKYIIDFNDNRNSEGKSVQKWIECPKRMLKKYVQNRMKLQ